MAKKILYVLMFSFLILALNTGTASAREITRDFHQSFVVKEGDSLHLHHGDGNVMLIPWEKGIIDVKVRYRADIDIVGIRLGRRDKFDVDFRQTANTVYVTGRETSSGVIGIYNKRRLEYIYEIHSPNYINLHLDGDDGDVNIENWAAEIECRIDDGDIQLKNIVGDKIAIWGEDGDVDIDNLTGSLNIEVDDGNVTLTAGVIERSRVKGEDGDITIRHSKGSFDLNVNDGNVRMERTEAKRLYIRSEDGDIDLVLVGEEKLDADIRTDDGDVAVDLDKGLSLLFHAIADDADYIVVDIDDVKDYKKNNYSKSGRLLEGEGRLKIRTGDGRISIRKNF